MKHISVWPNFKAIDSVSIGITTIWLIVLSGVAFYLGFSFLGTITMMLVVMSGMMSCSIDGKKGMSCIAEVMRITWKEFSHFPVHKKTEVIGWTFVTLAGSVVLLIGTKYGVIKNTSPPALQIALVWGAFGVFLLGIIIVMLSRIRDGITKFLDDIRPSEYLRDLNDFKKEITKKIQSIVG